MLVKPPLEELLPKVSNRYVLAMLAAQRARQLVDGARHYAIADSPNLVTLACQEIASGEVIGVKGRYSQRDLVVPLRPDIEAKRLMEEEIERNRREQDDFDDIELNLATISAQQAMMNLTGEAFLAEVGEGMPNLEIVASMVKIQQAEDLCALGEQNNETQAESSTTEV